MVTDLTEEKSQLVEVIAWCRVNYDKTGTRHLELFRLVDAAGSEDELARVDRLIDEWVNTK